MRGHVIILRLGDLGTQVADVDHLGLGRGERLGDAVHRHGGQHAGEQGPRADHDLVRPEDPLDRQRRWPGVVGHQ